MLTIRLTRKGKKNQPFFRVVVIDRKRSAKGGRVLEYLGYKNPLTKKTSLNKERILYWISKGAKPSSTVHNLLASEKIIEAKKVHVSKLSKKKQAEQAAKKVEAEAKAKAGEEAKASASAESSGEPKKAEKSAELVQPEAPAEMLTEKPSEKPKQENPAEPVKDTESAPAEKLPEEPK